MEKSFENREGKIWFNGRLVEWASANIHVLNHGLHYASSIFEGERAYNGKIFKSLEHSKRLFNAARTMDMDIIYGIDEILKAKEILLEANKIKDVKKMVLFCALGFRSALATKSLVDMGFKNVAHVSGGFDALKKTGLKTVAKEKK